MCVFIRFSIRKALSLKRKCVGNHKKNLGLPVQILKILVRMLNDRSNSEKSLNDQDLQEGGGTPPPTHRFRWISLITNMRCIFGFVKFVRPMGLGPKFFTTLLLVVILQQDSNSENQDSITIFGPISDEVQLKN